MSPRRKKLTSPQTRVALARGNRPAQHLLPMPGPVDTEAARRLFRAQRRQAARTVVLLSLLLFGVSGAFAAFPLLGEVRVAQAPLSWLLLTGALYPLLFGLALWHTRSAERVEARAERPRARPEDAGGDAGLHRSQGTEAPGHDAQEAGAPGAPEARGTPDARPTPGPRAQGPRTPGGDGPGRRGREPRAPGTDRPGPEGSGAQGTGSPDGERGP